MLAIGLVVLAHLARIGGPVKQRTSPPPSQSLKDVCPQTTDCQLSAGTYSIDALGPRLTFAVPDGWRVWFAYGPREDLHIERSRDTLIWVGLDPVASGYEGCPVPGGPTGVTSLHSPGGLADWMRRNPALAATPIRRVEIGGLEGVMLDAAGLPDAVGVPYARASCSGLAIPSWTYPMHQWVVRSGEKARTYFLELPPAGAEPQRTIVIGVKAASADFDAFTREVEPILTSFVFG